MKGKLITFEGCEGCGKSTQTRLLSEYLEKTNTPFLSAREPGGVKIAETLRAVILNKENSSMTAECEALLYAAARCQLLNETIIPALESGKLVILDRYVDSSLAYQAYGRGLDFDFVKNINDYAFKTCTPDITFFMNVAPDNAFKRKGGVDGDDRLETAGIEFHTRVYNGYVELSKIFADRFLPLDCLGTKYETHEIIKNILIEKGFIK